MDNEMLGNARNAASEPKKTCSMADELFSLLHDFVYILATVTIIFVFVVRLVGVDGSSMYPTLNDKDYMLLLSNFLYRDVDQGDIVVMTVPFFEDKPIVKRIIATAGQEVNVDFLAGTVSVDGTVLDEPYTYEATHLDYSNGLSYPCVVPEGCVFVMGDNRNNSTDSRFAPVGMVDERDIMGRAFFILLPGKQTDAYNHVIGGRDWSRFSAVS